MTHKHPCKGPKGEHLATRGKVGEIRSCLGCGVQVPVVLEDAGVGRVSCEACARAAGQLRRPMPT